jgi:hypothetical protein
MLASAGQGLECRSIGSGLSILMEEEQMATERQHVEEVEVLQTVHSLHHSPVMVEQRGMLMTVVDSLAGLVGIQGERRQSGLLEVCMPRETEWHQPAHMACQVQPASQSIPAVSFGTSAQHAVHVVPQPWFVFDW